MTNYRRKTIDDFVHDEIHICASSLVSEIIEVRNNGSIQRMLSLKDNLSYRALEEFDIDNIEWPIDEETEEPREVFEWWIVTKWIADKLKTQNECIIEAGFIHIWGRTCTGQSVSMDVVIEDIYNAVMNKEFDEGKSWENSAVDGRKWGN